MLPVFTIPFSVQQFRDWSRFPAPFDLFGHDKFCDRFDMFTRPREIDMSNKTVVGRNVSSIIVELVRRLEKHKALGSIHTADCVLLPKWGSRFSEWYVLI